MPRGLILLVVLVLLLAGGMVLLSKSAEEAPVKAIETEVTSNETAN